MINKISDARKCLKQRNQNILFVPSMRKDAKTLEKDNLFEFMIFFACLFFLTVK